MKTEITKIQNIITSLSSVSGDELRKNAVAKKTFTQFCTLLNTGIIRSAEKNTKGVWEINTWVKEGILLGMKLGKIKLFDKGKTLQFSDKHTLPVQKIDALLEKNIRVVPGGTSIRIGSYIGNNVVIMPPAYINTGAYIDEGTMIDSHVLVGSCAQIGKRCHISAGVQIGGVLEPINAYPCIVEDDVILGIQSAIAEGVIVKSRAVIGAGVIITASTPVYDVVKEKIYTAKNGSLIIPEGAVVIPGSRNIKGNPFAQEYGLHVATPIIKKYRDEKTDAKTALEMSLR